MTNENGSQPPEENAAAPVIWKPPFTRPTTLESFKQADALAALPKSVIAPREDVQRTSGDLFTWFMLGPSDSGFTPWGQNTQLRDRQLRDFITTEHFFASALGIISARNAALTWQIIGDEATAEAAAELVNDANHGEGWESFVVELTNDLLTQDKGAFVEFVRAANSPEAAVIGINALDAQRCFLTGNPETPVIYEDRKGELHKMPWYTVVHLLEMPTSKTPADGGYFFRLQYCALTRVLGAAQILKSITTYRSEKVSGRFMRAIHLLSGVDAKAVQDAIARENINADNAGATRYMAPAMVGNVDPAANVSHETIELASLPDGFSETEAITSYITILAMGFLTDYQEFAPLASGNLGTSTQSEVLHQKSRGKGVGLFKKLMERLMNLRGALPGNVTFEFTEDDIEADKQIAETEQLRAETRKIRIDSGEIDALAARQLALDSGDLTVEEFEALNAREIAEAASGQEAEDELSEMTGLEFGRGEPPPTGDLTPTVTVGDTSEGAKGPVTVTPDGLIIVKEIAFGQALADELSAGLDRTDPTAVGALGLFVAELQAEGIWDAMVPVADIGRVIERATKEMAIGFRAAIDDEPQRRAGPTEERIEFEEEVGEEIAAGLGAIRRRIATRLREAAPV